MFHIAKAGNGVIHHLWFNGKNDHCANRCAIGIRRRTIDIKPNSLLPLQPTKMGLMRFDNGKIGVKVSIGKPAFQHCASHFATPQQRDLLLRHDN